MRFLRVTKIKMNQIVEINSCKTYLSRNSFSRAKYMQIWSTQNAASLNKLIFQGYVVNTRVTLNFM